MTRLGTKGQRFFVLDYETTGVDTDKDHPIEVGVIVTDENFALLESFHGCIRPPPGLIAETHGEERFAPTWSEANLGAYRVHGITPRAIDDAAAWTPEEAGRAMAVAAERHTVRGARPVLVSDNIQFEWAFTKRLLAAAKMGWPFHYCGWDTSMLLEATGVGDPFPVPHRALADAGLLHAAILKALDRIRRTPPPTN